MDPAEVAQLKTWMEEVDSDEYEERTLSDPFSDDDRELDDPDFEGDASEIESDNNEDASSENDSFDNDAGEPAQDDAMGASDNDANNSDSWWDDTIDIPNFDFVANLSGVKVTFDRTPTATQVFHKIWTPEIMELIVNCTNSYIAEIDNIGRPHEKYSRMQKTKPTDLDEMQGNRQ